ncbi:hypothetical protein E2C01_007191 [Portunus trituberculatus]|uniref:Uncharacterized protein n=1 Tax=Portunus trituberculatus TaxID=210409 RepID=A0A5B7CZF0_PORTR|nr:hypothetical protein [Portunus trituberculatus]
MADIINMLFREDHAICTPYSNMHHTTAHVTDLQAVAESRSYDAETSTMAIPPNPYHPPRCHSLRGQHPLHNHCALPVFETCDDSKSLQQVAPQRLTFLSVLINPSGEWLGVGNWPHETISAIPLWTDDRWATGRGGRQFEQKGRNNA